ncbi:hypothetical protein DLH72_05515 [Candidatus Gracilibacteria bacterium]|nr:MAG: hypothetical protein DLH72_05515 [Candidatus Gracilibacteria bacterium]
MKDFIKRLLVISLFGVFAGYLVYSFLIGKLLVQPEYQNVNNLFYLILIIISLYISVFYGFYPIHIKFSRATLFVIGLGAIIMGKTLFLNDPLNEVYFGDLSAILGVVLIIVGPTNIITTTSVKKKKEEKNLEIIEV